MLKILEWDPNPSSQRQTHWKKILPDAQWILLQDQKDCTQPADLVKNIKNFDLVLIDSNRSHELCKVLPHLPLEITRSEFLDAILKKGSSGHWFQNFFPKALHSLMVEYAPELDLKKICYVVGAGNMAQVCIVKLIDLGFKKFNIVAKDSVDANLLSEKLKRKFFDMEFKPMKNSELPLQQNNGGVLINTLDLVQDAEFAQDLSYLNFIDSGGLVIDAFLSSKSHLLIEEALHVGLRLIEGLELFGYRDWLLLQEAAPKALSAIHSGRESFMQSWRAGWESSAASEPKQNQPIV